MVDNSLFSILLPTIVSLDSSRRPITEPALLMILSKPVGVTVSDGALPTQSRRGNAAGNNRLVEDLQHFAAQVLRSLFTWTCYAVWLPNVQSWVILFSSLHKVVYQCPLYSPSSPSPRHVTKAESSENFCRWRGSELLGQSVVYKVKRKGQSTSPPREAPLTTKSDRTPARMDKLQPACQGVRNPGDHWGTEKLQLLTQ